MNPLPLYWNRDMATGQWSSFRNILNGNITTQGVYVIWKNGQPAQVVRIGQGNVGERIMAHQRDSAITQHEPLLFTWAEVPAHLRDGVERYLAEYYRPLIGDAFPDVAPIPVTLVA